MFGKTAILAALAAFLIAAAGPVMAGGGGVCSELRLACENNRVYSLCPIAVSDQGEVVTARLVTGSRGGHHVRLIPMGLGYRYAGMNVWVDGVESQATIHFGKRSSVQCTVERG